MSVDWVTFYTNGRIRQLQPNFAQCIPCLRAFKFVQLFKFLDKKLRNKETLAKKKRFITYGDIVVESKSL